MITFWRNNLLLVVLLSASPALADSFLGTFAEDGGKLTAITYNYNYRSNILFCASFGVLNERNFIGETPNFTWELCSGFEVQSGPFYGGIAQGIATTTKQHRNLSSLWQFPTSARFGLQAKGARIGIIYKHFSNGTLSRKNKGLDFLGLEWGYVW